MPTARIIFKGLCAFLINTDKNKAAVLLVNHPDIDSLNRPERHRHLPRVRWTGFTDSGQPEVARWSLLEGSLAFDWGTEPDPPKLLVPNNFHDFVPRFTDVGASNDTIANAGAFLAGPNKGALPGLADGYVGAVVVCDAGDLEVSDVVRFWRHRSKAPPGFRGPKVPQEIRFVGTVGKPTWAGLATEARLYVESDGEEGAPFNLRFTDREEDVSLWPPPGKCEDENEVTDACHDIGPDKVEVVVTNFSRRMLAPLPYSVHYLWHFKLLASATVAPPTTSQVTAATAAWGPGFEQALNDDLADVGGPDFPFPVIPHPRDAAGLPISDEEDRANCPFVGGKD